jgi:hypothetical protein
VVRIVEGVEQILVERMDILQPGETLEDGAEFLGESLLGKLNLASIECSNTADFESSTDLGGQFALGATQHNVQELLLGRDRRDILPSSLHDGQRLA